MKFSKNKGEGIMKEIAEREYEKSNIANKG